MKQRIRWGIVGLGKIAHTFAKDMRLVETAELVAVASRNLEKASIFGKEYGAQYCFGSYQELFECREVDVLYIATPHTSHAELSIMAMNHGKHVLCEKPLGVNSAQVKSMIKSANKNDVFLMEALWSRFNPAILRVKELIAQGTIGDINYLYADFAFYGLDRSEDGRLLNPVLAGGSLLDIGIYPIFLAYLMLGLPERVLSASNFYKTGVEIQTSMIFKYPESMAILYSGLSSNSEMKAEISGSKGSVFIDPRWHESQGYTLIIDGTTKQLSVPKIGKGYSHEIEEVHQCLWANKKESTRWSHKHSMDLINILDQVRDQNGIVFPFEA